MPRKKYIDILRDYLNGELEDYELPADAEEYLQRLKACYSLLLDLRSRKYIYRSLQEQFVLSPRQCYLVVRDTEILFGDLNKVNKEMLQHIAVEAAKKGLRYALKTKDAVKISVAVKALVKAGGLDRDAADMPDLEKLQPNEVVTELAPQVEQVMQFMLSQGAVNLNKIPEGAEIIDYEPANETDREAGDPAGD